LLEVRNISVFVHKSEIYNAVNVRTENSKNDISLPRGFEGQVNVALSHVPYLRKTLL
jgi:hypothetical protein